MLSLGIDIGSLSTDVVLLNDKREIVASEVIATGASSKKAADKAFKKVLEVARLSEKDIEEMTERFFMYIKTGRLRLPYQE